jgi:lysophospholipid acyltransferase (LPLAT)-like uncharacterized protein
VTLPQDGSGNPAAALKHVARALREGRRVVIAVDGPRGPARRVRPGALWLARLSGCPIVPAATAARPAVLVPRWDRHVVPLPGARVAFAVAPAFHVARGTAIDDALCRRLGAAIDAAERLARELVRR